MKKFVKPSVFLMALIMLFSSFSVAAGAASDAWNTYWGSFSKDIEASIMLTPGSNETERYISWYSDSDKGAVVLINSLGLEAASFTASAKATPQGDYRLCAVIAGLEAGKTYSYYCQSGSVRSEVYSFTVDKDDSFTAMYMTDIHISKDKFPDDAEYSIKETAYNFNLTLETGIAKAISQKKTVDLILSAGDQASDGLREEYTGLVANPYIKSIPFATVIGNHDRKCVDYRFFTHQPNTAKMKLKSYVGTDYWFVKGNVLFLMIDSNNTSMSDHRRFVEGAVEANPNVKWRVAVFHHDLYSARIPSRESENQFLRLMWAPIADEFGFDLCLLGHSHYYTISNVLYNNKTVSKTENGCTVTDPKGTIYMVSGSINNPRNDDEIGLSENIGHAFLTEDKIYNLIDFSKDSITIKSYTVESDENIGSITIKKTTNTGGHEYKTPAKTYYPLIDVISFIAGFFNNIGRYYDNTQLGFKIPLFEGLFG